MDLRRRRLVENALTCLWRVAQINLVVLAATLSFAAHTGSSSPVVPDVKERIGALVHDQIAGGLTPGITVAIAKKGETIYENSAGVRDVSSHAPMLITTPQPIGSTTKQFTAAAILLLLQEKKP